MNEQKRKQIFTDVNRSTTKIYQGVLCGTFFFLTALLSFSCQSKQIVFINKLVPFSLVQNILKSFFFVWLKLKLIICHLQERENNKNN